MTTENIVRLSLDFAEHHIGHDGTVKLAAEDVSEFVRWIDQQRGITSYRMWERRHEH